jgi:hypothetical protein
MLSISDDSDSHVVKTTHSHAWREIDITMAGFNQPPSDEKAVWLAKLVRDAQVLQLKASAESLGVNRSSIPMKCSL